MFKVKRHKINIAIQHHYNVCANTFVKTLDSKFQKLSLKTKIKYDLAKLFADESWLFSENAYIQIVTNFFYEIITPKFEEILFNFSKTNRENHNNKNQFRS